jgi:quinolinate synthase
VIQQEVVLKTLVEKINTLKQKHKAVIIAHNYQSGEIQDIADFTGDSLGLSVTASKTEANVIVFCGVLFMAETAAILSPDKVVLLPEKHAGCPMADMITAEELRNLKQKQPGAIVVCYVNSSAEVKAESDYCCTSSNAVEVVNSLPKSKKIIFVPDKNLGGFVMKRTSRDLILWPGYCPSHVMITEKDIKTAKRQLPDAIVMAHPECSEPVKMLSEQILSTGQMLIFAKQSSNRKFIIATETGIIYTLKKENPDAEFIAAAPKAVCPNMKKITLEKVLWTLEDLENTTAAKSKYRISVPQDILKKAKKSLDKMVEIIP